MKRVTIVPKFAGIVLMSLALAQVPLARADTLPNFTGLVKENSAAVVNISTTQKVATTMQGLEQQMFPDVPKDSPFYEFFKRFFQNQPTVPKGSREERSLGSGFIISRDGYILTAAHVVDHADSVVVQLSDHSEKKAKVVGKDDRTDVALLKIDAHNLPTVSIGDSSKLEVGQWVLAIGSPFGLEYTATQGIVSALGRALPNETYVPFIQTDVALNPGNSGGPLFDLNGNVVGINSQIFSKTGGYMGLSFAIPINVAMNVADQIKAHGHVTRGWLGVLIQPVTEDLAQSFGLETPHGALVAKVTPDSPAQRAGVQPGDIILSYNGRKVKEWSDLPPMVGNTVVGSSVPVTVLRDGKEKELDVTIAKLEETAGGAPVATAEGQESGLNVVVTELTQAQRKQLGIGDQGVLVKEVNEGPGEQAGLRVGDVILMIDNKEVKSAAQLADLVKKLHPGKPVPVLVQRGDHTLFLALKMPAKG